MYFDHSPSPASPLPDPHTTPLCYFSLSIKSVFTKHNRTQSPIASTQSSCIEGLVWSVVHAHSHFVEKKMIFLLPAAINCKRSWLCVRLCVHLLLSSPGFCLEWIVQPLYILSRCLALYKHMRLLCQEDALSLMSSPTSGSYMQFEHWSIWNEKLFLKVTHYILNMALLFHFF